MRLILLLLIAYIIQTLRCLSTNLKLSSLRRQLADNTTNSTAVTWNSTTIGNTGAASTNATEAPLPLDTVPIPLPPTVHPGFPVLGRNTTTSTETNLTLPAIAATTIPLVPAPLTMLTNKTQDIPLGFWVAAGNKTYIVLRNENNDYLQCSNGSVSGEYHKGNLTELPISYLWEPVLFTDSNAYLRTYDGNYLQYNNYTFNCSSANTPSEYFKIVGGSNSRGGPNLIRTDYISFQKGNFYLGIENNQAKLLDQTFPNAKFVPIFNRNLIDNSTLPSS